MTSRDAMHQRTSKDFQKTVVSPERVRKETKIELSCKG